MAVLQNFDDREYDVFLGLFRAVFNRLDGERRRGEAQEEMISALRLREGRAGSPHMIRVEGPPARPSKPDNEPSARRAPGSQPASNLPLPEHPRQRPE
jgi:hypothetical protein